MITVDIWSDFSCPHCWIGMHRFARLLEELQPADVKTVMHSFELMPKLPRETDLLACDIFAKKCYVSREDAVRCMDKVSRLGQSEGLEGMDYANAIPVSTRDAHRLFWYARESGCTDMEERLMRAYFAEHRNLASFEDLCAIAQEAGLDGSRVLTMLESDAFLDNVLEDESKADALGIHSVPNFVVNGEVHFLGSDHFDEMRAYFAGQAGKDR